MQSLGSTEAIAEFSKLINDENAFYVSAPIRTKLSELCKTIESQIDSLHKDVDALQGKLKHVTAENQALKTELDSSNKNLKETASKMEETAKINDDLEKKEKALVPREYTGNPAHIMIVTNSLFDLIGEGWKIVTHDLDKIKKPKEGFVTISALGEYDKGKSWFLNKLGGCFDSGFSMRTNHISISLPEKEGLYLALVDTPGSKEAIQTFNSELQEKLRINQKLEKEQNGTETPQGSNPLKTNMIKNEEQKELNEEEESKHYKVIYQNLHNDRKVIDNLKERFIIEKIDVIFIIVGKLSESEGDMIHRNVNYYEQVMNANTNRNSKTNRNKTLYIVHNYKMLHEVKDVEAQIQKDILACFKVEKNPIFTKLDEEASPTYNKYFYRDHQGINHIVLAAEGSPAGDYYNTPAFNFINQKLLVADFKTQIDFPKAFLELCNQNLPRMLQQNIKLKLDPEKNAIVREDTNPIKIGKMYITDIGDIYSADSFTPGYSKTYSETDEHIKITLDVELLDCKFVPKCVKEGGKDFIVISGEKKIVTEGDSVNHSRLVGPVFLKIPLLDDKERPEIKRQDLKNGIWRFVVTYQKEDGTMIEEEVVSNTAVN